MERGSARSRRKRPVNLTLSEDLVTEAKEVTDNLSGVVESLLGEFLSKERKRRAGMVENARASVTLWNDFADRNGSIADEYSTL
ncbi:MAG TPA: type II toxin-antitoxin system CcdA family antitoxin [Steroidobacteraceae bacterium]